MVVVMTVHSLSSGRDVCDGESEGGEEGGEEGEEEEEREGF